MKRLLAAPLALVFTVAAYAHNGMDHVIGTVASLTATTIGVKSAKDGTTTIVTTDNNTMWMRGSAMITAKDVHTGERVVIHAKKADGKLLAAEVEVGGAAAAHAH